MVHVRVAIAFVRFEPWPIHTHVLLSSNDDSLLSHLPLSRHSYRRRMVRGTHGIFLLAGLVLMIQIFNHAQELPEPCIENFECSNSEPGEAQVSRGLWLHTGSNTKCIKGVIKIAKRDVWMTS